MQLKTVEQKWITIEKLPTWYLLIFNYISNRNLKRIKYIINRYLGIPVLKYLSTYNTLL